jgi:hypothetical protein
MSVAPDFVFTQGTAPTLYPPTGTSSLYVSSVDGLFYQMNSAGVITSLVGATGSTGATGAGVATGGTAGQALVKNSSTNYDTSWVTLPNTVQVALTGTSTLGATQQSVEVNSATACTINLPAANSMITSVGGNQYPATIVIFNTGTGVVTVAANGANTIVGAATAVLEFQWSSITLYPNFAGTGWMIV